MKKKTLIPISILSLTTVGALFLGSLSTPQTTETPAVISQQVIQKPVYTVNVEQLYTLVNIERTNLGISSLSLNQNLNNSALDKCNDMVAKNYWAHNAPDGTEPWSFIDKYTNYSKAGENLATGYFTSQETTTAWMNSPSHKANIIETLYTDVGYAICDFRGTKLVVQHFIALQ